MAEEFVGEVTVRASSNSDMVVIGRMFTRLPGGVSGGPGSVLTGPITIKLDADAKQLLMGTNTQSAQTARIAVDAGAGALTVRDHNDIDVFKFEGRFALLQLGGAANHGDLHIRDSDERVVLRFDGQYAVLDVGAAGNEGDIRVFDNDGDVRIHLDGDAGDIKLMGGDCAERFELADSDVEPGTVLATDVNGDIRPSTWAYQKGAIGIVSGAGGLKPGIVLASGASESSVPVALAGRVEAKAVGINGPITPGDLLTTSDVVGTAMRATDPDRAFGAVLGKALGNLDPETGRVPILVSLH